MTFTVRDYHDLVSLLYRYPEWRAELRVGEPTQAQRRTNQALERLSERVGVTVEEEAGSVLEVGLI